MRVVRGSTEVLEMLVEFCSRLRSHGPIWFPLKEVQFTKWLSELWLTIWVCDISLTIRLSEGNHIGLRLCIPLQNSTNTSKVSFDPQTILDHSSFWHQRVGRAYERSIGGTSLLTTVCGAVLHRDKIPHVNRSGHVYVWRHQPREAGVPGAETVGETKTNAKSIQGRSSERS